ncbi:uncharacterized protein [Ptychodera flava]|uniref:uncharacterized protein n=1 Tax=Ptychodera flava TaxID=63121 RepID=UPI00396AACAF
MYCLSSSPKKVNSSFISCTRCRRLPPFFAPKPPDTPPHQPQPTTTALAVLVVLPLAAIAIIIIVIRKRRKRYYNVRKAQSTADQPCGPFETAEQEEDNLPSGDRPVAPECSERLPLKPVPSDNDLNDNYEGNSDRQADEAHRSLTEGHEIPESS